MLISPDSHILLKYEHLTNNTCSSESQFVQLYKTNFVSGPVLIELARISVAAGGQK